MIPQYRICQAQDFHTDIAKVGWSVAGVSRRLRVSPSLVRSWCAGTHAIPEPVAEYMRECVTQLGRVIPPTREGPGVWCAGITLPDNNFQIRG